MPSRWKYDRPPSFTDFLRRFSDDRACADYLFQKRWPNGFVCPECGGAKGWELGIKKFTWECAACGRQTSVTAGIVMHRSKVALRTWFLAAHLMATHSNGLSALQMQAHLGPSRWGRCRPHPSQTRTCRFPASGSSWESFARDGILPHDPGWRQRMAAQQFTQSVPSEVSVS